MRICFLTLILFCSALSAQVYSPNLLAKGQPDTTDLQRFAEAIYLHADAQTPREKAEAIWRFFLTDGRYVKPGFWYHIAGWAYEEPYGEVLDPIKLLNSYGFGLCYHVAPLLQAVFKAGGFEDARTWFLTGHTVTEVFYDGAYHYFDSDMMGYNVVGDGSFRGKPVASVEQIEHDPAILLDKLQEPNRVKEGSVDYPWYPADVHEKAIPDLANLFTTTNDNYLYSGARYSTGNSMDFVLRPGEKMIRFFKPEEPGLYYLPYKFDGHKWTEFPQEFAEYQIRTNDGPRCQKDGRLWATGRIEYQPKEALDQSVTMINIPSPYVIIDAHFKMHPELDTQQDSLRVDTSVDGGLTWLLAGEVSGPFNTEWSTEPKIITKSEHGRLTAVSGSYGYQVRITRSGGARVRASSLLLVSRIQLNPRSLPAVKQGENTFIYSSGPAQERIGIPAPLEKAIVKGLALSSEQGQALLHPISASEGEADYVLDANGRTLASFDVGARFLDLSKGLAPDKLTAETRHTAIATHSGAASIAWATNADGPFQTIWTYPRNLHWPDGQPADRLLIWPEAFQQIRHLPAGTKRVYVKLLTSGPAIDNIRLAVYADAVSKPTDLTITQQWSEGQIRKEHVERISDAAKTYQFRVDAAVRNEAIVFAASNR